MTTNQRRVLRDCISAVGVGKTPVLLEILAEIEDDFELLKTFVIAQIFDGQTAQEITEFLREICIASEKHWTETRIVGLSPSSLNGRTQHTEEEVLRLAARFFYSIISATLDSVGTRPNLEIAMGRLCAYSGRTVSSVLKILVGPD